MTEPAIVEDSVGGFALIAACCSTAGSEKSGADCSASEYFFPPLGLASLPYVKNVKNYYKVLCNSAHRHLRCIVTASCQ